MTSLPLSTSAWLGKHLKGDDVDLHSPRAMLGAFAEAMMWAQASMHRDADYRGTLRRAEELPQPVAAPADGTLGRAPSTWWPEVALLGPTKLYTPSKKER